MVYAEVLEVYAPIVQWPTNPTRSSPSLNIHANDLIDRLNIILELSQQLTET